MPSQKSFLTAAVAASALIANFVIVGLVNRFGIRSIFVFSGVLSAVATMLLPTAIRSGFAFTFVCRVLQGAASLKEQTKTRFNLQASLLHQTFRLLAPSRRVGRKYFFCFFDNKY